MKKGEERRTPSDEKHKQSAMSQPNQPNETKLNK